MTRNNRNHTTLLLAPEPEQNVMITALLRLRPFLTASSVKHRSLLCKTVQEQLKCHSINVHAEMPPFDTALVLLPQPCKTAYGRCLQHNDLLHGQPLLFLVIAINILIFDSHRHSSRDHPGNELNRYRVSWPIALAFRDTVLISV